MNFGNRKFKFQGEFEDPWSLGSTKLVDVIVLSLIKLAKIILSGRLQFAILTFLSYGLIVSNGHRNPLQWQLFLFPHSLLPHIVRFIFNFYATFNNFANFMGDFC